MTDSHRVRAHDAQAAWKRPWLFSSLLCCCFTSFVVASDAVRFVGESRRTAQRLAAAAALEDAGRWSAAVDLYLAIINDAAGDLAPVEAGGTRWLPANWIVHRRIARSPDLLAAYRARADAPAGKMLEPALAARDVPALQRLVATMFCARPAGRAIDALGDLACERGDFAAARAYWAYLTPNDRPDALAFPQPTGDPALPSAKMIVARMLAGEVVADDLAAFADRNPDATGSLAGRNGRLIDILNDLARSGSMRVESHDGHAMVGVADSTWFPDFSPVPPFLPIALPEAAPDGPVRSGQRSMIQAGALAFLPTIVMGHALVADARRISALDLSSGQLSSQFDIRAAGVPLPTMDTRLPSNTDMRYAVTVAGDRVYARFGQQRIRADRTDADSVIAALRFRPDKAEPWKLLWTLPARNAERAPNPVMEGAPLVVDGRLFVAVTRIEGNRAITAITCVDPAEAAPLVLWQHDVLDAPADSAERTWHVGLTSSEGRVVLGPLAGALVALDAATGQPAWAIRSADKPRGIADPSPPRHGRDCLAANGVVYAFIADDNRAIAVDSAGGTLLWESDPLEATHLIGAAAGKLIVQTGGLDSGLVALNTATGRRTPDWGYSVFGADAAAPFGRGILLGERICWPTRNAGIMVARLDGSPEFVPTVLRNLPGGNLVFADGMLLVATAERLCGAAVDSERAANQPVQTRKQQTTTPGRSDDRGAMR